MQREFRSKTLHPIEAFSEMNGTTMRLWKGIKATCKRKRRSSMITWGKINEPKLSRHLFPRTLQESIHVVRGAKLDIMKSVGFTGVLQ
jgi:hypothetical protein